MPFTKVKHFFLFGQTSFPETYFEQINNYIYLTGHFNIKIYDMLYSWSHGFESRQQPILQSKETGPTYLKSFLSQGLIS